MLTGIYLADKKGHLVFEYLVLGLPHYSDLVAPLKSNIAYSFAAPAPQFDISATLALYARPLESLVLFAVADKAANVETHTFLERLEHAMGEYFGTPISASKIELKNHTLTLLVNEMVATGIPNNTDTNKLKDVVVLRSALQFLLETTMPKTLASLQTLAPAYDEEVAWRTNKVRYTNNEMFVDVLEHLKVIYQPKKSRLPKTDSAFYSLVPLHRLVPVAATIDGQVDFLSHLSGVPLLQVVFSGAHDVSAPQFHPCVQLDAWMRRQHLSFIPPDGRSTLMTYQIDVDAAKTRGSMLGLVEFDCQLGMGAHGNEFELRAMVAKHMAVTEIEKMAVEIVAFQADSEAKNAVSNMKGIRVTHGDFRYKGNGIGVWTVKHLPTGTHPTLRGAIVAEEKESVRPAAYNVLLSYKGSTPSGVKVESVAVVSSRGMGDGVKPYKGVKYVTQMDAMIRA